MRAEERAQQSESHISTMELICSPTLRAPLMIGIVMQLSQQFSGINAVFYYSTSLFVSSGLSEESAKFATIGIGAIMVGYRCCAHTHTLKMSQKSAKSSQGLTKIAPYLCAEQTQRYKKYVDSLSARLCLGFNVRLVKCQTAF